MAANPTTVMVTLPGDEAGFHVTTVEAQAPRCVGLFAAGLGGNPMRHLGLLQVLAAHGCTIIAPHFDRLRSPVPTKAELDLRARQLEASADRYASRLMPLYGIGHSVGTVSLLSLAGGEGETRTGEPLSVRSKWALNRLALLAPPVDFLRRPGALRNVKAIHIWVGDRDTITPPSNAACIKAALEPQTKVTISIDPAAGHFTFMNELPPNTQDVHPDRDVFLTSLAAAIAGFLAT